MFVVYLMFVWVWSSWVEDFGIFCMVGVGCGIECWSGFVLGRLGWSEGVDVVGCYFVSLKFLFFYSIWL